MKRYILVAVILVLVFMPKGAEFYTVAGKFSSGEYCFYLTETPREEDFDRVVKNGDGYIGYCPIYKASQNKDYYKSSIEGESFCTTGTKATVLNLVNMIDGRVISEGEVDGIYTVYLYTGRLNTPSIELFGDKVNLQIVQNGDKVTVGYPIILGSY